MPFMSIDDRRKRIIQDRLVELIDRLAPSEILPHLTCLSKQSKEKIYCRLTQEGPWEANRLLLQDLPRKDKWWEQLMAALRHPSVGMEDLADSLESKHETITESSAKVDWSTPLRELPFSVVQVLRRLDVDSKWKDLAAHLGCTLEQVQMLETYTSKEGSHVRELYNNLATNLDFNLLTLVTALTDIERYDVLKELGQIKEFRHLKWPDPITSRNNVQEASVDNVTTMASPETCSGESGLCIQSQSSNNVPWEFNLCSSGSRVPPVAEELVKTTPDITLGNEQPTSVKGPDDVCRENRHGQDDGHNDVYVNDLYVRHGHELRAPVTVQHFNNKNENNLPPSKSARRFPNCTTITKVPQNIEPQAEMIQRC